MTDDAADQERTPRPWRVLNREMVLRAPPYLEVTRDTVELPDGRVIDDYYGVASADYAVIVAVDGDENVLALHGYRHGAGRVLWEFPAGALEPGESPESAARRELREETGYEADEWQPLGSFVVDGNRKLATAHLFAARGLRRVAEPASGDLEDARPWVIPWPRMLHYVREGDAVELVTAAAVGMVLLRTSLTSSPDRRPRGGAGA